MTARLIAAGATAVACLGQTPPSLLSRGLLPQTQPAAAVSLVRPYLGVVSGYDSGPLNTGFERAQGPFQGINGGLEARSAGPRADFQMRYRFATRYYTRDSSLDHTNQGLDLEARLRLSKRVTLLVRDKGTSASFGAGLDAAAGDLSGGFFIDGGPEALHARTLANTALADVIVALSARTSVAVGGDGFLVQHQYRGLADAVGWRARADLAHRYARQRTVTLSYSFTHFDHPRSFGGADYDVWAVGHSWRIGKRSELDLLGGAGRLRSDGLRAVELDREIARLLGTSRGVEIFRLYTWTPHLLAAWTRQFGRAALRAQYARVVTDGGGLSGVARQNLLSATLSAPLGRSWSVAGGASGRTYRSLDTLLYDATTASGGATLVRRLGSRLELVWRYQYSFHHFQRGLLRRFHRHQESIGLAFHFADLASGR